MERIEAAVLYDYLNRRIPLTMSEFMIGRSQNAHFVINDQKVSRQHARISYKNGIYVVSDLNSRNGTFVNGKNISDHETNLHGNDRIHHW
jgi:pSer/pThr/pTyr-binding forkhead associated (FHA) protein